MMNARLLGFLYSTLNLYIHFPKYRRKSTRCGVQMPLLHIFLEGKQRVNCVQVEQESLPGLGTDRWIERWHARTVYTRGANVWWWWHGRRAIKAPSGSCTEVPLQPRVTPTVSMAVTWWHQGECLCRGVTVDGSSAVAETGSKLSGRTTTDTIYPVYVRYVILV